MLPNIMSYGQLLTALTSVTDVPECCCAGPFEQVPVTVPVTYLRLI